MDRATSDIHSFLPVLPHTTLFPSFSADEEMRPVMGTAVKATFLIAANSRLVLSKEQRPVLLAGELQGDPANPSFKYEPEATFFKPATDVALIGCAHAPTPAAFVDVGIKVGPVQKVARVFGDRYWIKAGGSVIATRPQPFQRIPLQYELAFGGWDRAAKDETKHRVDRRNTVGRGFGDPLRYVEEGKVLMPNIEDPNHLIRRYGDTPPPVGFGFVSPHWEPRSNYAGTYDEAWQTQRKPLLPKDFDRRFFNAASPGLIAPGYLRGDEEVVVVSAAPVTPLKFRLPGLTPPICRVQLRGGEPHMLQTNLDTVIVNTNEMLVFLTWRAYMNLRNGPPDVLAIDVLADAQWQAASR
jgi:hypothetical protein